MIGEDLGNNPEKSEDLKKSPVFVMFRENEVLNAYRDTIVSSASEDRVVEVKTFPAETDEDEIKIWVTDNLSVIDNHILLVDGTVYYPLQGAGIKGGDIVKGNLDKIINSATNKTLLGDASRMVEVSREDPYETLENEEDTIQAEELTVKNILATLNPEDLPKSVLVRPEKMDQHCPSAIDFSKYPRIVASYFSKQGIETSVSHDPLETADWEIVDRHASPRHAELPIIQWPLSSFYHGILKNFPYLQEKYKSKITEEIKLEVQRVLNK